MDISLNFRTRRKGPNTFNLDISKTIWAVTKKIVFWKFGIFLATGSWFLVYMPICLWMRAFWKKSFQKSFSQLKDKMGISWKSQKLPDFDAFIIEWGSSRIKFDKWFPRGPTSWNINSSVINGAFWDPTPCGNLLFWIDAHFELIDIPPDLGFDRQINVVVQFQNSCHYH